MKATPPELRRLAVVQGSCQVDLQYRPTQVSGRKATQPEHQEGELRRFLGQITFPKHHKHQLSGRLAINPGIMSIS